MASSHHRSSSSALFYSAAPPAHPTASHYLISGDQMDAESMPRASFQGGPPPGAFMLGPSEPSWHLYGAQQYSGGSQENYDYSSSTPAFIPYSPSDYNLPAAFALSSPESQPFSHDVAGFSWPPPHRPFSQSPLQQQQQHYHHHHHYHRVASAAGDLRPSLSQSTRGSRDSGVTDPVSDVSSSGYAEFTPDKFDDVVDSMDSQTFNEKGNQLFSGLDLSAPSVAPTDTGSRSSRSSRGLKRGAWGLGPSANVSWLTKLHSYANSQLPPDLPPLRLYMPTWPLLCLAAQFSNRAYAKPAAAERETYIEADGRDCPKAMVIKSVALDHMNLIVFAIRGSTLSFRDWATNMDSEPSCPVGFLDDAGNLCHTGFLSVAKQMVGPVAARLQQLLEENPSRRSCSLIITGHSAGGAVASLLYAHMLSQTLGSELIALRDRFKRVHCVSFGAPPISLLPLAKPAGPKFEKWLFFSFINEGDPVVRAEKPYVRALLELYNSPPPQGQTSGLPLKLGFLTGNKDRRHTDSDKLKSSKSRPVWKVPHPTLTLAGRIIVLRKLKDLKRKDKSRTEAQLTNNDGLADVMFGDLLMHPMKLYERRIQILATDAVTAKFAEET